MFDRNVIKSVSLHLPLFLCLFLSSPLPFSISSPVLLSLREPAHRDPVERRHPATPPVQAADLSLPPSAFRPSLRHRSPSPIRAFPPSAIQAPPPSSPSSVRAPPCSSPFRAVAASSPTPSSAGGFTSPTSRALPCFSPTPSSGRSSSMRAPPPSSPPPSYAFTPSSSSSTGRSSSMRAGPPSSPTPSSPLRSPAISSPTLSSSAFTRSLAASCISQSISQSIAKKNASWQQAPPVTTGNQGPSSSSSSIPSSHLRLRSPSPKTTPSHQGSSTPAHAQLGSSRDGYQHPRCPPASLRSSCSSPVQSPPPCRSQRSPSPLVNLSHYQHPLSSSSSSSPSLLHSKSVTTSDSSRHVNNNNNNNNNTSSGSLAGYSSNIANSTNSSVNGNLGNGSWPVSQRKAPLASSIAYTTTTQQSHDPLWSGSHNRVARPFSSSEPSSRVQSPSLSPSPSPASFSRLCSPPPQHNYSSPMANKPPHPRSMRGVGGASPHNPLGLTLELPRASSTSSATRPSSSGLSPCILSPPPIGVSVNAWANNMAAPQPRNPHLTSSSPSSSFSSCLASPLENAFFSSTTSSFSATPLQGSRASSPSAPSPSASSCYHTNSQNVRRSRGSVPSFSSSLADRPPSPARSNPSGLRRSWAESSRRSLGFGGSYGGSFDQQESGLTSPRSGWSSYGSSPSCLSPQAGLQSPLLPSRLTPGEGTIGGQHFTSVPWPDVRELLTKYDGTDTPDRSDSSSVIASSPSPLPSASHTILSSSAPLSSPSVAQTEWRDPELEEGNCRSQLICAFVARPSPAQNPASSCLVFSSSGMTSPPPPHYQHQNYPPQVKPQHQVQNSTTSALSSNPSPVPSTHSAPTKPGSQKTSYATTVNLQIAGSGRITSFSTAQVSLTQTLQAGAGAGGQGQGQGGRRVSINGLSHLPPPSLLPQNCKRL